MLSYDVIEWGKPLAKMEGVTPAPTGTEVLVKDTARFKGGWAFFNFGGANPGQLLPPPAAGSD